MNAIEAYYAEGEAKGIEKGIKKGIEKGIKKGLHIKSVHAIKKMVEKEMPISLIIDVMEVSEAFVKGVMAGTITEME